MKNPLNTSPAEVLLNGFSTQAFAFSKQYYNNILCKMMQKLIKFGPEGNI